MSIRTKILGIVFFFLLLSLAAFVVYSVNATATYRKLRLDGVGKTVELAGEKINALIGEMERNAIDFANAGAVFFASDDHSDATGERIVMENFHNFPDALGGGIWYEPFTVRPAEQRVSFYAAHDEHDGEKDGKKKEVRINPALAGAAYDYHNREWYREIAAAPERHKPVWTRPYFDYTGVGFLMTTVGVGIYHGDERFVGMATVDWRMENVLEELSSIRPTDDSFILLASPRDDYVLSDTRRENAAEIGSSLADVSWFPDIPLPEAGRSATAPLVVDGRERLAFSVAMDNGWVLTTVIPADEIFAELERRTTYFLIGIAAAAILLPLAAFHIVSRLVNSPIQRLMADVDEVGRGNLDRRVQITTTDELGLLGTAFNRMTGDLRTSIEKNARERAERDRMAGELDAARRLQGGMLPNVFPPFPKHPGLDLQAVMFPAFEVGGDFYDFFLADDRRLVVAIADVSGKGVSAALFMVVARTLLRRAMLGGAEPAAALAEVNNLLCENNEADMFVTVFLGCLETESGKFSYANAGHNPPLLRRKKEGFSALPTRRGLALGAMENRRYEQDEIVLQPGDTLLLYTDGATEAENAAREQFSTARLTAAANRRGDASLRDLLAGIKEDVDHFADGAEQCDDLTLLALRTAPVREMTLPALPGLLHDVQNFVAAELEQAGCPAPARTQMALAVEEVFINIASYAYRPNTGSVTVRVACGDEAVVEFEDWGQAYNPLEHPEPRLDSSVESRRIGGLGILLVKRLMDGVAYSRIGDGNVLALRKNMRPEKRAAANGTEPSGA